MGNVNLNNVVLECMGLWMVWAVVRDDWWVGWVEVAFRQLESGLKHRKLDSLMNGELAGDNYRRLWVMGYMGLKE